MQLCEIHWGEGVRLDAEKGFFLQENAAGRKARGRVGRRVTDRNELCACATNQEDEPGYQGSVL
jgi:hypothetical protein